MYNEVSGREYARFKMRESRDLAENSRLLIPGHDHKAFNLGRILVSIPNVMIELIGNLRCAISYRMVVFTAGSNSENKPR